MIRELKRYFALRGYLKRLSQELPRRFGKRQYYSVEQVIQAVYRGGHSKELLTHAHAAFCDQPDFAAHYKATVSSEEYLELRRTISRRCLFGRPDFDALALITRFKGHQSGEGDYHESGIGMDGSTH
ncbi:MAG TPA: DUF6559 family protein [Verrucomicrobiae bacterium]|jgi:hypothetical protein|nr:DUF6559 family protein [Verrucomicrobiae bacterium]